MIYGYARISTPHQNLQRQVDNLRAFDSTMEIVKETWSGRTSDRPAYRRLTGRVREGDTIVFDSVSRMSRDADQGVKDYFNLSDRGVELNVILSSDSALQDRGEATGQDLTLMGKIFSRLCAFGEGETLTALKEKIDAANESFDMENRFVPFVRNAQIEGSWVMTG
jgi:DNA invertase Pin-like site-specific DNA recombinase